MPTDAFEVVAGELFEPGEWLAVGEGYAVPRAELGPCSCGGVVFEVRSSRRDPDGPRLVSLQCPRCLPRKAWQLPIGSLDVREVRDGCRP